MKIVAFAHYTCGGLLCDILNGTFSPVNAQGGIESWEHNLGKLGDSDSVYEDFSSQDWQQWLSQCPGDRWIGTHCWLGDQDLSGVTQVVNVTTMTYRSRLYRWIRAYHHYFQHTQQWQAVKGMELVDKQRETAKNYLRPYRAIADISVTNIEFSDIVEQRRSAVALLGDNITHHTARWRLVNPWLYDSDLWNSDAALRFHEADYETSTGKYYVYD